MEVHRNVVLDLLPLYLSGEASAETRALVDAHLATDADLGAAARELSATLGAKESAEPTNGNRQLEAFREAQRYQYRRTVTWAGVTAVGILAMVALALLAARMIFL